MVMNGLKGIPNEEKPEVGRVLQIQDCYLGFPDIEIESKDFAFRSSLQVGSLNWTEE